ncbi:MBOAT-domain-containing protein [Ascodesmis nigricans]|uniref:MBOAT-domain-containing protein n=1 Tax=Ascodesmis nigricans TaxID=341454 RepID=A0A4S2MWM7_9PEZI|nr:MBOAT-domain-containing protein [Ascodesmis nigricans]
MLPFIDYPFIWISNSLGASKDELKLVFSVLLSYPLCGVLKRLPDAEPWKKSLFLIIVSVFYLVGLFDLWGGVRTLLISAAGTYAIAAYFKGPMMPWIGFAFLMGHMLTSHVYREFYPQPGVVDVTGAQMVLVMKLSAFCWNLYDGTLPIQELNDFQKDRRIEKLPNLLNYTAYVFFFPSLFAGPAFDYREFERWLDCSMFNMEVPDVKRGGMKKKRKIPKSSVPATYKAVEGIVWILAFTWLSAKYPAELYTGDEFTKYGMLRRYWLIYVFGFVARTKYYGIWSLTEGACILSGLGFNGVGPDGKACWDRCVNVKPKEMEKAANSRAYLENWNIKTNTWLRNYVYLRVTPKGKKPGFRSSMVTFGTSALWHGTSPGYYLSFLTASFVQTIAKNFRRHIRPLFLTATTPPLPGRYKPAYDVFGWVVTQITFSYIVAPFLLLNLADSICVWKRLGFLIHIGIAVSMAVFASPAKKWVNARQRKRVGRVEKEKEEREEQEAGPMGLPDDMEEDMEEIRLELRGRRDSFLEEMRKRSERPVVKK